MNKLPISNKIKKITSNQPDFSLVVAVTNWFRSSGGRRGGGVVAVRQGPVSREEAQSMDQPPPPPRAAQRRGKAAGGGLEPRRHNTSLLRDTSARGQLHYSWLNVGGGSASHSL